MSTIDGAYLISPCVSGILFGIHTAVFFQVLLAFQGNWAKRAIAVVALCFLYFGSAASLVVQMAGVFRLFITYREHSYQNVMRDYARQVIAPMHLILYLDAIVGDCFLCWRLFVLWNRRKVILVAPVCLLLPMIVTGAISVKKKFVGGGYGHSEPMYLCTILAFGLSTTLNLLATSLICWKILGVSQAVAHTLPSRKTRYSTILRALIDSCALYTLVSLSYISIKIAKQKQASIIVAEALTVLVGLVPTLMFLRLQLQTFQPRYETISSRSGTLGSSGATHGVDASGSTLSAIRFAPLQEDVSITLPGSTAAIPSEEHEMVWHSVSKKDGKSVDVKPILSVRGGND